MSNTNHLIANPDRLLTVVEVAKLLRCSKAHVLNLIHGRVRGIPSLPALHLGRRCLIRGASLNIWVEQNEQRL